MKILIGTVLIAAGWLWGWWTRGDHERRNQPAIVKARLERDNRAAYQRGRVDREREIRAAVTHSTSAGHEHLTPPDALDIALERAGAELATPQVARVLPGISERDSDALPGGTLGPAQIAQAPARGGSVQGAAEPPPEAGPAASESSPEGK
jgi:hypothetical protein